MTYSLNVIRRMQIQGAYQPEFEDWLFHVVLPIAAYAILALAAIAALSHAREALFGIGAAALLLLFIGIHNAWDASSIMYISASAAAKTMNADDRQSWRAPASR